MSKHMKDKHKEVRYCDICNEMCISSEELQTHIKNAHKRTQSEKDKKDCEHCSYKYWSDSDMKYHMMIDHWYKRCDQCKQIFSDRKQLKEHMKKESHSNIIEENTTDDEDLDVSIDEERMERF